MIQNYFNCPLELSYKLLWATLCVCVYPKSGNFRLSFACNERRKEGWTENDDKPGFFPPQTPVCLWHRNTEVEFHGQFPLTGGEDDFSTIPPPAIIHHFTHMLLLSVPCPQEQDSGDGGGLQWEGEWAYSLLSCRQQWVTYFSRKEPLIVKVSKESIVFTKWKDYAVPPSSLNNLLRFARIQ